MYVRATKNRPIIGLYIRATFLDDAWTMIVRCLYIRATFIFFTKLALGRWTLFVRCMDDACTMQYIRATFLFFIRVTFFLRWPKSGSFFY